MNIKNVLVAGTGTLGSEIGFQCARHGFKTTMYDINEAALEGCRKSHREIGEATKADLGLDDKIIEAAHANLSYSTDLATAASDCDLVSESVPEVPEIKCKVFAELNEACPDHTIFTTNSSSLLPSQIAEATGRPKRFLALHFANRIWSANFAEVMKHPGTSSDVFERVLRFAKEIGMVPIKIEKENNGYVLNALLIPLLNAAQTLVANGIASPFDVDRTWMIATSVPMGPFATIDAVGLDLTYTIGEYWAGVFGEEQARKNLDYLKKNYLDKGKLSKKSGEGFYTYPDPEYAKSDFLK